MFDITSVPCGCGLKYQNLGFLVGYRSMLDPVRYNQKFPWSQFYRLIAKLNPKASTDYQKEFVFYVVMVPDEGSLEFNQFDLLPIEFTDDLRSPMFVELGKLLSEIDFLHFQNPFLSIP